MPGKSLNLKEALRENRLADFVAQEEARVVEPVERGKFDDTLARIIKPRRSVDRTSRSPSRGGSAGK